MERIFKNIFAQHQGKLSDKWSLYINKWDELFSPYQNREINLLEIGTQNGGSLEIFAEYFPQATHIIGCDIEADCQSLTFGDPRITVISGDINSDPVDNRIAELAPQLDIIIDDGSHQSRDVILSFCRYFKMMANHGLYLIEDLHANYWGDYDGGLYQPYTAIAFFKRLVDITNFEHWQNHQSREKFLLPFIEHYQLDLDESDFYQIHAIKFINSLCVIQKRPPEENTLGRRVIAGSEEAVSDGYRKFNGITIHDLPKATTDDTHLDVFSLLDRTDQLQADLSKEKQTTQQLQDIATDLERSIEALKTSVDEKEQSLGQLTTALNEKQETLEQARNDLYERDLAIEQLNTIVSKLSQTKFDLESKIEHQHQAIYQLQMEIDAVNKSLFDSQQNLDGLKLQMQELSNEILFYALSKSWRLTRPLRKFMDILLGRRSV